jgi:hypothetical protein
MVGACLPMWNKVILAAAAALIALSGFWGWAPEAKADAMLGGPYGPEGIRIPASIELLADTPYYDSPDQPDDKPEGVFAPQTVKVIKTQAVWSVGAASWQIETMFGPRWIRPKPWEIDIAPPKRITLVEETPLYRSKSERGGPVASLSPQEVQVTGAEKQWFYTNQPGSKAWIQVHTTWLGDLWAHIPVNKIGTVEKVQQRRAHYTDEMASPDLGTAMSTGVSPADSSVPIVHLKGDYPIVAEYTTIYDRAFQVQTDNGPVWTRYGGIAVLDTAETLELTTETPLIDDIWSGSFQEIALLRGEKATAFEKVEEPLYNGRGPYPIWNESAWYHVRTSKGTGWINKLYGEPASAVPVHWKVDVRDQRELLRYPGVSFETSTLLIRQQTVEATAAWDDPNGNKWLRVAAEGHTGWIHMEVWSAPQDRIWDEDADTALQISMTAPDYVGIVPADDNGFKLYNQEKIGYTEDGKDYFEAVRLARELGFKTEKLTYADAVMFSQGDYAFVLENGFGNALIYWKGSVRRSVKLLEHPRRTDDGWYVNLRDLRSLLGLTGVISRDNPGLFEKMYKVEPGKLPVVSKNGRLEIQAFLYDPTTYRESNGGRLPVLLSIEENGDQGGEDLVSREEAVISGTDRGEDAQTLLYRLTASRPLSPGTHQVDLVLRVGERIVWSQTITVKAE